MKTKRLAHAEHDWRTQLLLPCTAGPWSSTPTLFPRASNEPDPPAGGGPIGYVGVQLVRRLTFFIVSNHEGSLYDVASRSGLGRFFFRPDQKVEFVKNEFAYLAEMSQIFGILCNNGHVAPSIHAL